MNDVELENAEKQKAMMDTFGKGNAHDSTSSDSDS